MHWLHMSEGNRSWGAEEAGSADGQAHGGPLRSPHLGSHGAAWAESWPVEPSSALARDRTLRWSVCHMVSSTVSLATT